MAETRITNVVVPTIFTAYTMERTIYLSRFFRSGVSVVDPVINDRLNGGGLTFNVPFWKELTQSNEVPAEASNQTINPITTGTQIAIRQMRVQAWGSNDMSAVLAGDDPMRAIGDYVAGNWAKNFQTNLMSIVRGVIADNIANDSSDLVNDISIADGDNATDDQKIGTNAIITSAFLLGDQYEKFAAIAMHSVPYQRLVEADLIDFVADSEQDIVIPRYMGMEVILDDEIYSVAGGTSGTVYWTVLFERGAFSYGESTVGYEPTEVDRDPDAGGGIDQLFTRRVYSYHPRGFAWQSSSMAGEFPTDAELATAANWDRVYNAKNAGFVALLTNG